MVTGANVAIGIKKSIANCLIHPFAVFPKAAGLSVTMEAANSGETASTYARSAIIAKKTNVHSASTIIAHVNI